MRNKVIVIGCGTGGLAVIRGLSAYSEIEIIALAHTLSEIGCVSRYVSELIHCPHPGREETAFIAFLMQRGEQWKGSLLIEAGDYMAVAVAKHKQRLQQYYRTSIADFPVLQRLIEKDHLYRLAEECGVPYPTTFYPKTMEELERVREPVPFPCILKPVNSHLFVSRYGVKNFEVTNADALRRSFQRCLADNLEVMIQEIIPGPDSCLERLETYINSKGKYSARFYMNKLRQHPPKFGVMRVGYSVGRNQEAELLSERMLQHVNYRGYASVEFKRDQRDSRLKLMEINVRMPRPGLLAIAAGVNFPWIIYQDIIKDEQIYVEAYKLGFYWIELLPDLWNIVFNPYGEKRYTLSEFLRPYLSSRKTFAIFDWKDPWPFLRLVKNGVAALLGLKLPARTRREAIN